eukprot:279757_1
MCDFERGIDGYIAWLHESQGMEVRMKKKKIIRRSKNKEYKDRMDKYGTAEFLYQIQAFVSNKKKRLIRAKMKRVILISVIIITKDYFNSKQTQQHKKK